MEHFDVPTITFLFDLELSIDRPYDLGKAPIGNRQMVHVSDGYFRGPDLNGTVTPGGNDWVTVLEDRTIKYEGRLLLKTFDGVYIVMNYNGIRTGDQDVIKRLERHEVVDINDYYSVVHPSFETSSQKYDWLNKRIFVARGRRLPEKVYYSIYTVGE